MSSGAWILPMLFTVAIPAGWLLGGHGEREGGRSADPGAPKALENASPNRVKASGYAGLLHIQEEAEAKEKAATEADAFEALLADWSDAEFAAALDKAQGMPECRFPTGANGTLPFRVFGAWIAFRPDAAAAWIDTVRAGETRDRFVREACRQWPAERALDGIDFLLRHHWKEGASYSEKLMDNALNQAVREGGANGAIGLLEKLAKAKIKMTAEHPDFPRGFDFKLLAASPPYQAHDDDLFRRTVNAAWVIDQPGSFFEDMRERGDWERFNTALRAGSKEVRGIPAVRLWEAADPDSRRKMLKAVDWLDLGLSLDFESWFALARERRTIDTAPVAATRIATLVHDPALREEWVEGALGHESFPAPVRIELLETLPDPSSRIDLLRRMHPEVDWRPEGIVQPWDPGTAPALREAIRRWGVSVPPLPARPPVLNPFGP